MTTSPQGAAPDASWPRVLDPYRRSLSAQRSDVMAMSAEHTSAIAAGWLQIAHWFEDTASAYDATLEYLAHDTSVAEPVQEALETALSAFDRAGEIARDNAEIWDDLASEVTLAQARMSVIWVEYQNELRRTRGISSGPLTREYSSRSAREVWLPMQEEMRSAGERIQPIGAFPEDRLSALLR